MEQVYLFFVANNDIKDAKKINPFSQNLRVLCTFVRNIKKQNRQLQKKIIFWKRSQGSC
jgi:hypothetical protein